CARSMYSWWRRIWSQNRRAEMAHAHARKKRQTSQKRATRKGMARGALLRVRVRCVRSVADCIGVTPGGKLKRLACLLRCGCERRRLNLRQRRRAGIDARGRMNHLARLRRRESKLARHAIDARRLRQLRLGQAKLPVLF